VLLIAKKAVLLALELINGSDDDSYLAWSRKDSRGSADDVATRSRTGDNVDQDRRLKTPNSRARASGRVGAHRVTDEGAQDEGAEWCVGGKYNVLHRGRILVDTCAFQTRESRLPFQRQAATAC
jgi:hypothetical protein